MTQPIVHSGERIVVIGVFGIILVNELHSVKIQENDIRVPAQHLLQVNIESAGLSGGIRQIVGVDQRKGTVAGLCTLEAMGALKGNTSHINRRLFTIRNVLGAVIQVLLNAL